MHVKTQADRTPILELRRLSKPMRRLNAIDPDRPWSYLRLNAASRFLLRQVSNLDSVDALVESDRVTYYEARHDMSWVQHVRENYRSIQA